MTNARKYINDAIPINTQLKAWRGVAINYELLNRCDFSEKSYVDAKHDLNTGMPFALLANESYIFSQYSLGFGKLQAVAKNPDSAKYYFNKALKEAMKENQSRNEYQAYLARSSISKKLIC